MQTVEQPVEQTPILEDGYVVEVIPYNADFDAQSVMFLPWFWKRLKEDGLLEIYYPGAGEYSFPSFVKMLSNPGMRVLLIVRKKEGKIEDCVGFCSYNPVMLGTALVACGGYIFLKDYWDRKTTLQAAHRAMKFWFTQDAPILDIMIGIVAHKNVMARRFLHRMGWTQSGMIPGIEQYAGVPSDAEIWYITKAQWEALAHG